MRPSVTRPTQGIERLELIFETGIMGGYTDITGFRVRTGRPHANCTAITFDAKRFRTHNGVHLGQTSANFERVLRIKFKRRGSELRYEGEGRSVATAAELKELRGRWPNEAQSYIDVTTTIRARFVADRLVDFCVRKIESY